MDKKIRLIDIASKLGMSKMTVSLALRDDPSIPANTREKIKELASDLNYVPNNMAKNFNIGKTYTIAAIVGGALHDDYHNRYLKSALHYAMERGYTLAVGLCEKETAVEKKMIEKFRENMVEGFLVFHSLDKTEYVKLKKAGIPFVLYTKYFDDFETDYVVCDDKKGGYMMTSHLISLGHKKIAYVYDRWLSNSSEIVNRMNGYNAALQNNGIAIDEELAVPFTSHYEDDVLLKENEAIGKLLLSEHRPTAVFVCNDVIASSFYLLVKRLGLRIPEDISIGGYEGVYLGAIVDPGLTTITTPIQEIGRLSCEILLDKIEGKIDYGELKQISLEPVLTIRSSVKRRYD